MAASAVSDVLFLVNFAGFQMGRDFVMVACQIFLFFAHATLVVSVLLLI